MSQAVGPMDRLARAVHLDAVQGADGTWCVTGGASPHIVLADGSSCDCPDFAMRSVPCKHILAVRLRRGEAETLGSLRELVPLPSERRRAS